LVASNNQAELKHELEGSMSLMVNWFTANKLALNITKTNIIRSAPKQSYNSLSFASGNLLMNEVLVIKFLGLQTDKNLDW
jgi:hypothetical protein